MAGIKKNYSFYKVLEKELYHNRKKSKKYFKSFFYKFGILKSDIRNVKKK